MRKSSRGKYLVDLATRDAECKENRTPSPFTEEQKRFLVDSENNNDFRHVCKALEQNSPVPATPPEITELMLEGLATYTQSQEELLLQCENVLDSENNNDFRHVCKPLEQNSSVPATPPEITELMLEGLATHTQSQEELLLQCENVLVCSPITSVGRSSPYQGPNKLESHLSEVSSSSQLHEINELIPDSERFSPNSPALLSNNAFVDTPADPYATDNNDSDPDWIPPISTPQKSYQHALFSRDTQQQLVNVIEYAPDSSASVIEESDNSISSNRHVVDPNSSSSDSADWIPPRSTPQKSYQHALFSRDTQQQLVNVIEYASDSSASVIEESDNSISSNRHVVVPNSSSSDSADESLSEEELDVPKKRSKKRARVPARWKRQIAKDRRLQGKSYVSAVSKHNKIIKKKRMKPPCPETCKLKCNTKISGEVRMSIFQNFWKTMQNWDQRRQFVASSIDVTPVARPRDRKNEEASRRKCTRVYHLNNNNSGRLHVCQKMFINTLCVTEQFISTTLLKTSKCTNVVEPDQRGKHEPANKTPDSLIEGIKAHILSFPQYTSHYSRDKTTRHYLGPELNVAKMYNYYIIHCKDENLSENSIGKEWLYRKIFNEEFNLSFYSPSKDTCDTCDKFILDLKQETAPAERQKIEESQKKHLEDANNRYSLKKKDKENSKSSAGTSLTLMLDMQKCLPTPLLTNTQSFYLRKLWVLNETLHDDTSNKSYCMMWNEVLGGRGGNEVGSCLIEWVLNYLVPTVTEITIWSDNCAGQNRNIILVYCYLWILAHSNLTTINHKFLLRGHTHSEVDMIHSIIERKKKELPQFEIMTPRDWEQFVKICKPKNPLTVHSMNLSNIKNIKSLSNLFSQRRKNWLNEPFLISKCVWFQLRKDELGVLFYKTSFNESEFSKIDLRRNTRQPLQMPYTLPQVNSRERPISNPKYKDLMTLTQWMTDSTIKNYYKNLPHGNVPDIEESDED